MVNIPIGAETIFSLGSLPVSNTLLTAFLVLIIITIASIFLRTNVKEIPGGFQNFVEMLLEFLLGFFDQVTGDREKSRRFLPIAGTMFFFILFCNWFGLVPGFGTIGVWRQAHEGKEFIPFLRSANSDLNLTLAMAMISVVGSHVLGMMTLGIWVHINKFVQISKVWKALKTLKPINILTALVEFVVGIIEIFSEFAKIASLSLRLFGNVFAGEVLLTVIASLIAYFVPLPFMAIEIIVGIVQATVFSMLTLVYLTMMTSQPHGQEAHGSVN